MSHSIKITLIADQEIRLLGDVINIHDIETIKLNSHGVIVSYSKSTAAQQPVEANSLCCGNPCFVWEAGVEKCINCGAVTVELSNRLTNS